MKLPLALPGRYLVVAAALLSSALFGKEDEPGVERWSIKTSVPAGADIAHGKVVSFIDLVALPDPVAAPKRNDHAYAAHRYPAFTNALGVKEGDILTVQGWLHLVAGEGDGDYHIQISDNKDSGDHCLIIEVPKDDPAFMASAELRDAAKGVRDFLKSHALKGREPSEGGTIIRTPLHIEVTGQLFFDDAHVKDKPRGKHGMKAATLWELHPVTEVKLVP